MKITLAVLAEKLDNLIETNKEDHADILTQVKITNGRTTNLEGWRNKIVGGLVVANLIMVPLMFIVVRYFMDK